jgi:adenylate cyclase
VPDPEASINALRAAVMMQGRLPEITFPQGGAFSIGIGLHYGDVLHGNLGSERIMQYTVIGDTVNTAARLCDKCKPGMILVSDKFIESLGREVPLRELEPMQFKGKSEPMKVYEYAGTLEDLK